MISPDSSYKIAQAIVGAKTDFERTRQAGMIACEIMKTAFRENKLSLSEMEVTYLNRFEDEFQTWFQGMADAKGIVPDPDAGKYDYRAFYQANKDNPDTIKPRQIKWT